MQRTLFDETTATKGDERITARPPRAAIVPVRLTEGERDQLAEVARDLGISLSTYMRQADAEVPGDLCELISPRSEEHTSELQSHHELASRLLLVTKIAASPAGLLRRIT